MPDYQRASRVVVKDYSEGKLLYCHSPPPTEDNKPIISDEEYQRETLLTAIRNTNNARKLQKLQVLEAEAKAASANNAGIGNDFDDFDSILDSTSEGGGADNGQKRGKAHKSIKVSLVQRLSLFHPEFKTLQNHLTIASYTLLMIRNGVKRVVSYGTKIHMDVIQTLTWYYLELQQVVLLSMQVNILLHTHVSTTLELDLLQIMEV